MYDFVEDTQIPDSFSKWALTHSIGFVGIGVRCRVCGCAVEDITEGLECLPRPRVVAFYAAGGRGEAVGKFDMPPMSPNVSDLAQGPGGNAAIAFPVSSRQDYDTAGCRRGMVMSAQKLDAIATSLAGKKGGSILLSMIKRDIGLSESEDAPGPPDEVEDLGAETD